MKTVRTGTCHFACVCLISQFVWTSHAIGYYTIASSIRFCHLLRAILCIESTLMPWNRHRESHLWCDAERAEFLCDPFRAPQCTEPISMRSRQMVSALSGKDPCEPRCWTLYRWKWKMFVLSRRMKFEIKYSLKYGIIILGWVTSHKTIISFNVNGLERAQFSSQNTNQTIHRVCRLYLPVSWRDTNSIQIPRPSNFIRHHLPFCENSSWSLKRTWFKYKMFESHNRRTNEARRDLMSSSSSPCSCLRLSFVFK